MRGKHAGRYSPKRRGGADEEGNRWLGTYGDAVTLLMAFFVMLYAMSQIDHIKFEAFVSGLEAPFGNSGTAASNLDGSPSIVGDAAPALVAPLEPSPAEPVTRPITDAGVTIEGPDLVQLEAVRGRVDAALDEAGMREAAAYHFDARGLVISIAADGILFETGSARVGAAGTQLLRAVAGPLRAAPNELLIEGHTDDVPLDRAGYTNWNLSTDRAVAVLSLLADRYGIAPERLGAVGYGEFRPLVPNSSAANRSTNRRVDILVVAHSPETP